VARYPIVGYLGFLVERSPYSVSHIFPDYRESAALAVGLNGFCDIRDTEAGTGKLDTFIEALPRYLDKLLGNGCNDPCREGGGTVTVVALIAGTHVDLDDVTLFYLPLFGRNTVDDFIIDRATY
jgi:hypothetical protein